MTPFEMSIVPERPPSIFGATEKLIAPSPVPLVPELMVINPTLVVAVHEQLVGMLIAKLPLPPVTGKAKPEGVSVKAQAVVEVCRFRVQLPPMLPALLPLSSTTKSFQIPVGALP